MVQPDFMLYTTDKIRRWLGEGTLARVKPKIHRTETVQSWKRQKSMLGRLFSVVSACFATPMDIFNCRNNILEHLLHISFRAKPPPTSCSSLFAKMPLKSAASPPIFGASPLFGALGLATLLRFSCPALDGKVGNMAVDLGLGSSLKYG